MVCSWCHRKRNGTATRGLPRPQLYEKLIAPCSVSGLMPPDVMPPGSMPRIQPVQSAPTANRADDDRQTATDRRSAAWHSGRERQYCRGEARGSDVERQSGAYSPHPGRNTYAWRRYLSARRQNRVQSAVDSGADASGDGAVVPLSPARPLARPRIGSSRCAL